MHMASVLLLLPTGDAPVEEHVLKKEATILGRHPNCDVVIPYLCCARRHASEPRRVVRVTGSYRGVEVGDRLTGDRR